MAFSIPFKRRAKVQQGERVEHAVLSQAEFDGMVDAEARRLLGVSGGEFRRLKASGELPEKEGVRTLAMMLDLESL